MSLITIGSILIGIAVVSGLVKDGEMGCGGIFLVVFLVLLLIVGLFASLLFSIGGEVL
jgi:hypothetical protein